MANRAIIVLIFVFLFLVAAPVYAEVLISEIKYSPTSKQWIEIFNDTNSDIDITTFRILDSGASVNGHSISVYNNASNLIPSHGYGVVSKSPEDFGSVTFPIFKSSLNIKVSSDNVILRNEAVEGVSTVNIDGTAIDGNSIQKINNIWKVALPTPGLVNEESLVPLPPSGNLGNNNVDTQISNLIPNTYEAPSIKTKINGKNVVYAGIPFELEAINTGYSGDILSYGKNYWNFGDGSSKEQINSFNKINHIYYYPGQYILTLEYMSNPYSDIANASNKFTVKVIPVEVIISKIGTTDDFFIEILNNSDYEIDISKWKIVSSERSYLLPRGTVIQGKNSIILSPKITNFVFNDRLSLQLFDANQNLISKYKESKDIGNAHTASISLPKILKNKENNQYNTVEPTNENDGKIVDEYKKNSSFIFFIGFAILI